MTLTTATATTATLSAAGLVFGLLDHTTSQRWQYVLRNVSQGAGLNSLFKLKLMHNREGGREGGTKKQIREERKQPKSNNSYSDTECGRKCEREGCTYTRLSFYRYLCR